MSFWGLSNSGKNDQGNLAEVPRWGMDAMKYNLARRDTNAVQGDQAQSTYQQFLTNRLNNGFGTPADIRSWGQAAMPGVDAAVQRTRDAFGNVQSAANTNSQTVNNLDTNQDYTNNQNNQLNTINLQNYLRQSGIVNNNANANTGLISSVYPSMMTGVNDTYGSLRNLNSGVSRDLLDRNANTFGNLRDYNQSLYDDLIKKTGNAYSDAGANINTLSDETKAAYDKAYGNTADQRAATTAAYDKAQANTAAQRASTTAAYGTATKNLERLLPGGDLMAAGLARSYAPNVSATNRRLIASGIDPNSAEGSSQLQSVEADRAHGMDDLLGANSRDYVGSQNALTLGNNADQIGLGRDQNALTVGGNAAQTGLVRDQNTLTTQGNAAHTALGLDYNDLLLGGNNARNNLSQTQFGNESALSQGQGAIDRGVINNNFNNESNLAQTQGGTIRSYQQQQAAALQAENNRNTGLSLGIDQNYGNNDSMISDTTYQRTMAIQAQRTQAITAMRNMGMQDAEIQQQLEQMGLNASNQQFQTGMQGVGANVTQQNLGGQGLGSLGQFLQQLANTNDASGRAWSGQTFDQSATDLGVESANAGWGTKLLMSMLGPALSAISPGLGAAVGSIAPAVAGGVTGTPGFTPAGSGSGGMSSLMSFIQNLFRGSGGDMSQGAGY